MSRPSAWTLLRPKWLSLYVFTVAACYVMILLGRWQWRAAIRHHGQLTNYSYAFQWWAFSVFAVIMCGKIVRDYLRSRGATAGESRPQVAAVKSSYLAYQPPPVAVSDDPELVAFNSYLAGLADREQNPSEEHS